MGSSREPGFSRLGIWIVARGILTDEQRYEPLTETMIIFRYWFDTIMDCVGRDDFVGAWNFLQVALQGEASFDGPNRICRSQVEGEHVGLICSPRFGSHLVGILYTAMLEAGRVENVSMGDFYPAPDWGPLSFCGSHVTDVLVPKDSNRFEDVILKWQIAAIAQSVHRAVQPEVSVAA